MLEDNETWVLATRKPLGHTVVDILGSCSTGCKAPVLGANGEYDPHHLQALYITELTLGSKG